MVHITQMQKYIHISILYDIVLNAYTRWKMVWENVSVAMVPLCVMSLIWLKIDKLHDLQMYICCGGWKMDICRSRYVCISYI